MGAICRVATFQAPVADLKSSLRFFVVDGVSSWVNDIQAQSLLPGGRKKVLTKRENKLKLLMTRTHRKKHMRLVRFIFLSRDQTRRIIPRGQHTHASFFTAA